MENQEKPLLVSFIAGTQGAWQIESIDAVVGESLPVGLEYLPAIARRLHHSRDLFEPFDFLTWFEYAPEQSAAFEELVSRLRHTKEWDYVDREVDIRLARS